MSGKVLMLASVASMIDQFNIPNIKLLISMGYKVDVACNFIDGSTCSEAKIAELKNKLKEMDVDCYQIDFARSVKHIWQNIKAYRQVLKLMQSNHYAFIHCHSPIGGVCGRLAGHKTHTIPLLQRCAVAELAYLLPDREIPVALYRRAYNDK